MLHNKTRSSQQIHGDKAVSIVKDLLPKEWVVREMVPDYGIDLDVELFSPLKKGANSIALGEHLFMQVKGTINPRYGEFHFQSLKTKVIKYQLETAELNLVNRLGSAIPVLLIIVDLNTNTVYQICLNDYIKKILLKQGNDFRKSKSVTINIPVKNTISSTNIQPLIWYGMRTKIYSMFNEMIVDIDDFEYLPDIDEQIEFGKRFLNYYSEFDILNLLGNCWYCLKHIGHEFRCLKSNDFISINARKFVLKADTNKTNNLHSFNVFIDDYDSEGIPAYKYAQKVSFKFLFDYIKTSAGTFETYCRDWFMPCLLLGVYDEEIQCR